MVSVASVKLQLTKAGYKFSYWTRAEVKELCDVLMPGEIITQATNGYYENGFALLVATDNRLLLIDRKPMFLSLDTISYGMIQEVTLDYRLLNSSVHIFTSNKVLVFKSRSPIRLRAMVSYIQQSVNAARQYGGGGNKPYLNIDQNGQFSQRDTFVQPQLNQAADPTHSVRFIEPEPIPTMPMPSNTVFQDAPPTHQVTTNSLSDGMSAAAAIYKQPLISKRRYERRIVA
jgi:hypothetical protein